MTLRPAAGPPGTVAMLTGRGFPAGRPVEVLAGRKALATARADTRGVFSASLVRSSEGRSMWRLVSASGRTPVTSIFRGSERAVVAEVASSTGRRLRWRPFATEPGATVRMVGSGFRAREPVRTSLFGRRAQLRASRRGRIKLTLAAPRRPGRRHGAVRAGGVSLPLSVDIRAPDSGPPGAAPPPLGAPPPATPFCRRSFRPRAQARIR